MDVALWKRDADSGVIEQRMDTVTELAPHPAAVDSPSRIQNCKLNISALSPKSSNNTSGAGSWITCGCSAAA